MQKNNKILITGGCGFIGSAVIRAILNDQNLQNYQLIVVDNLSVGKIENLENFKDKIAFHQVDIRNKEALEPLFKGVDYVIHLAANVSIQKSILDPSYSHSVNLYGFLNILELAKNYQIKNLVYASSAAVYGNSNQDLSEDSSLNPISPYGFEKMANEYYAKFYQQYYNLNSVGLRFFNVYGPGNNKDSDYAGVIKIFADAIKNDQEIKIYGDGLQTRDFIFVEDIAKIVVQSLIKNLQGIFNLATGKSISILELATIMQQIAGKNVPINFLPAKKSDALINQAKIDKIKSVVDNFTTTEIYSGLLQLNNSYDK